MRQHRWGSLLLALLLLAAALCAWQAGAAAPKGRVRGIAPLSGNAPVPLRSLPPGAQFPDPGPSHVVFPAQRITVRMSHDRHVRDLGMKCVDCHARATTSERASDRLLPAPRTCDRCHGSDHSDRRAVKAKAGELLAQCGYCHLGYRPEHGNRVERFVLPRPNLKFSHARHARRNIGCGQCHGAVQDLQLATRDQLPRMKGCFRCHQMPGPARGRARGECLTCHLAEAGGTHMKTSFAEGRLEPPSWLHDSAHDADWLERHKRVAGQDSRYCETCHQPSECVDCHDGRVRPRRVHPADYLSLHGVIARQRPSGCESCHRTQSFCVSCHQRVGISQSRPYGAFAGRGRFHPPASTWTEGPRGRGHHAWEAQRNLAACVSCHVERDCVQCHATAAVGGPGAGPGIGGGVAPHGPGFRARCRTAFRKNPRPCLVCHDPADPSLGLCR